MESVGRTLLFHHLTYFSQHFFHIFVSNKQGLGQRAERILSEARSSWGSFTDIKLELNSTHGYILRTPRADDERQLRTNNSNVRVISILKNGVHFTTPALERISERSLSITAGACLLFLLFLVHSWLIFCWRVVWCRASCGPLRRLSPLQLLYLFVDLL